jgi:hypothetical protein
VQRLAELGLLEALLDLGPVAVEAFDLLGGALGGGDIGEDEADAVAVAALAVEAELELLGVDRAPPARALACELGVG